MATLAYQQTGYVGANVTHSAAADNTVTETFNKADGALGPNLTWTRKVFTHGFPYAVSSNQCVLSATSTGLFEDIQRPTQNVSTPTQSISYTVTAISHTGTGDYVVDTGGITRVQFRDGDTNYRGYACAVGRNNVFVGGVDTWHLAMFRVDGVGNATLIGLTLLGLADVTLPGTFTFTTIEDQHTATFSHAGSGATMTATVTDSRYSDGTVALGGSVENASGATGSITLDNLSIAGDDDIVIPDTRGFLWVKNSDASSRTATVSIAGRTFQQANPDAAVAVPAGQERLIGPFTDEMAYWSGGLPLVAVNYSAFTGVSAAAVRVSTPPPDLP